MKNFGRKMEAFSAIYYSDDNNFGNFKDEIEHFMGGSLRPAL